jgi:hypothetical protein
MHQELFSTVHIHEGPMLLSRVFLLIELPDVLANTLNLTTKRGILIKKNCIFDKAKKITTIAFDRIDTLFTRINKIGQYDVLYQNLQQVQDLGNVGRYWGGNQALTC